DERDRAARRAAASRAGEGHRHQQLPTRRPPYSRASGSTAAWGSSPSSLRALDIFLAAWTSAGCFGRGNCIRSLAETEAQRATGQDAGRARGRWESPPEAKQTESRANGALPLPCRAQSRG